MKTPIIVEVSYCKAVPRYDAGGYAVPKAGRWYLRQADEIVNEGRRYKITKRWLPSGYYTSRYYRKA